MCWQGCKAYSQALKASSYSSNGYQKGSGENAPQPAQHSSCPAQHTQQQHFGSCFAGYSARLLYDERSLYDEMTDEHGKSIHLAARTSGRVTKYLCSRAVVPAAMDLPMRS